MPVRTPTAAFPVVAAAARPSFSVVIPTFQAADTVGASISSAIAQVHPPHEILVVDDGSTDRLDDALAPYAGRIQLIRKSNGGGSSALNAGMRAATGDFLAILDADDSYHEQRLDALARLSVQRPDLDLITTDAQFVVGGRPVGRFSAHNPFATADQRKAILASCFVGGWPAIRLRALRAIGGFDESLRTGYDWDCWLRLIFAGAQAGLVDLPYYRYHLHSTSLTADRTSSLWDRVRLLEKARDIPAVRDTDATALERSLRFHRSRAVMAEAAIGGGVNRKRRRLLTLSVLPGVALRARAGAVLAAGAPPVARRLLPVDRGPEQRFLVEDETA